MVRDPTASRRPRGRVFLLLAALAVGLAGCGEAELTVDGVADLAARGDELLDSRVQVTAQVEFVAGELDRFRIKDPDQPSEKGILVRCTPEEFDRIKRELERLGSDRITLVGLVYRTAPPDSKLALEFERIAGSRTKWLLLAGLVVVAAAIAVVVVLLLRRPRRSLEDLIYAADGDDTIRRYGQISIYVGDRLTRAWFLSYDRNIAEARITDSDMVLGTEGVLLGRDNPVLGLSSMTISRRIATLRFDDASRRFVLVNSHDRKPLAIAENGTGAGLRRVEPGREVALGATLWLWIDEHVRVHLLRRADEGEPGTLGA